jgi:hypothetical protein
MNGGTTKQVASVPAEAGHATSILAGLAEDLGETLPSGSSLVVCWRDPQSGDGMSAGADATPALLAHAQACLDGETGVTTLDQIDTSWDEDGIHIAIAARLAEPLPPASRAAWLGVARRMVAATLASARAQARIVSLQKSQRLQQALYEIADLASSRLEMQEILSRIHAVVGGLMYAENFFIVLYDEICESVRFLYFADLLDTYVA